MIFKPLSCLLLLSLFSSFLQAAPLPRWVDLKRETPKRVSSILEVAPPADFHIPAEYEPQRAVVLGWAAYPTLLKAIASAVTFDGDADIWAAEGPSTISGVLASKYESLDCPLNSVWVRDYGPFGVTSDHSLAIVDTRYRHYQYRTDDDALPLCVAQKKQIPSYTTSLILDGGNLMVDSQGHLFMTKRIYNWNSGKTQEQVNQILKDYFHVKEITTFDYAGYPSNPADGTGHIDMYIKLLNDMTVLIAESAQDPYKKAIDQAITYFTSKGYKIVRVPGYSSNGTWYTYTNSLIVNNLVMVPSYNKFAEGNRLAKEAYEKAMPGKKVVMIPSDESITSGGSIHCVTQQIPR